MKMMIGTAVALTLLGTSAAFAQSGAYHAPYRQIEAQNRYEGESRDRNDYRENRERDRADRRDEVRDYPHWSRGDRLPPEFRGNTYVVADWNYNHLRRPPRGFHWVHANNQFVLVGLANGIIADVMMENRRGR